MPRPAHLIPLTKAHYTAIGRVAAEWTALENFVLYAVRVLLDGDSRASLAVTANLSFMTACDVLAALVRVRLGTLPWTEAFCKMIDNLNRDSQHRKNPRTRRNAIVHGSWVKAGRPLRTFVITYKASGNLRTRQAALSAKQINAFADEIADLTGDLMAKAEPLLEQSCQHLGVRWLGLAK